MSLLTKEQKFETPKRNTLIEKLHPRNFSEMSPKMAAIVAYILGEIWTSPRIMWMSISSDGFVTTDSDFIGSVNDLTNNINKLIDVAELTPLETSQFRNLMISRIDNFYDKQL